MQTFLPYSNFEQTAAVLDRQRLGKQRVEALQILSVLTGQTSAWEKHPAVLMWKGYEGRLVEYFYAICDNWIERGYTDTCRNKVTSLPLYFSHFKNPPWLGDPDFHRAHQSNLVRKNPNHYRKFFPDVPNDLPYIWPV